MVQELSRCLATAGYDLAECVRMRKAVPFLGKPSKAVLEVAGKLPQWLRERRYWHDPNRNALVGMHLGVDLIRHAGTFYVLEINQNAAIRPQRRALYDQSLDPLVSGIVSVAKELGFRRVVPYSRRWSPAYVAEFARAGVKYGVDVLPRQLKLNPNAGAAGVGVVPEDLGSDTFHVVGFQGHSALDHFIHDKYCGSVWFEEARRLDPEFGARVRWTPTFARPTIPALDPDGWPNLVVKLSSFDQGKHVLLAKVRTEAEACDALGLDRSTGIPPAFGLGVWDRLRLAVTGSGRVIYQPFIPPEVVDGGYPRVLRLHLLVSPLVNRRLSAHAVVAGMRAPDQFPFGLLDRSLVVSFSAGARYERLDASLQEELGLVGKELGHLLQGAIERRFHTGP